MPDLAVENEMVITMAEDVPGLGVLVEVTTRHGYTTARQVVFIPGAKITTHEDGRQEIEKA